MRLMKDREEEIRSLADDNWNYARENNMELCQEVADVNALLDEIDALRTENDKLRTTSLYETSLSYLFDENVKLKARIEKLREALAPIGECEAIVLPDGTHFPIGTYIRGVLAMDDDEVAKG